MRISVIVPAYRCSQKLPATLQSILTSSIKPDETLVVCDGPDPELVEIAKTYHATAIELPLQSGPATARNKGAEASQGDLLFFIDSDAVLPANLIETALSQLQSQPEAVGVSFGSSPLPLNTGFFPLYCALNDAFYVNEYAQGHDIRLTNFFSTRCGAIKREAFFDLGGFEEGIRSASVEDLEFSTRLFGRYTLVGVNSTQVSHYWPTSLQKLFHRYFRNSFLFAYWIQPQARQFPDLVTTKSRAFSAIAGAIALCSLLISLFAGSVSALVVSLLTFCIYAYLIRDQILFWRERAGTAFAVSATFLSWALIPSIGLGYVLGTANRAIGGGFRAKLHAVTQVAKAILSRSQKTIPLTGIDTATSKAFCNYLVLAVTGRCDARCRMCFYWENIENAKQKNELSISEIQRVSQNMGSLFQLVLSGGEPFLRKDIFEIAEIFSRNNNLAVLSIPTNGSQPKRIAETVEKICRSLPKLLVRINISLDGNEALHDEIRRFPGLYKKTLETSRRLQKLKSKYPQLAVNANTVLMNRNESEIIQVLDHVKEALSPDMQTIAFPRGNFWESGAGDVQTESYRTAVSHLLNKQATQNSCIFPFRSLVPAVGTQIANTVLQTATEKRMVIPCVAGQRILVINESGDVFPCEILESFLTSNGTAPLENTPASAKLGNLREWDFQFGALMNSAQAQTILKYIADARCHCTWECAIYASSVLSAKQLPKIAVNALFGETNLLQAEKRAAS